MKKALPLIGKIVLGLVALGSFVFFALPFLLPVTSKNEIDVASLKDLPGRFVSFDGYSAYVIEKNQSSKDTVVLLHGFGSNATAWGDLQGKLAKAGFRVIAIDFKGFGYSQPRFQEDDYSHIAQSAYIARVVSLLGVQEATVVGHSMGANIAIHLATSKPTLVKRLVLIDPAVITESPSQLRQDILASPFTAQWVRVFATYGVSRTWIQKTLTSAYAGTAPSYTTVDAYYSPTTIRGWKDSLVGIVRDSGKNAVDMAKIPSIDSVLILWGEADTWVPVTQLSMVQKLFPAATTKTYPDVGHVPQEVIPDRVSADIISFMKK